MKTCECKEDGFCTKHLMYQGKRTRDLCLRSTQYHELYQAMKEDRLKVIMVKRRNPIQRVVSIVRALYRWGKLKFFRCRPEDVQFRRQACNGCPGNESNWCRPCGCYIPLKTFIPTEKCPARLWNAIAPPMSTEQIAQHIASLPPEPPGARKCCGK